MIFDQEEFNLRWEWGAKGVSELVPNSDRYLWWIFWRRSWYFNAGNPDLFGNQKHSHHECL